MPFPLFGLSGHISASPRHFPLRAPALPFLLYPLSGASAALGRFPSKTPSCSPSVLCPFFRFRGLPALLPRLLPVSLFEACPASPLFRPFVASPCLFAVFPRMASPPLCPFSTFLRSTSCFRSCPVASIFFLIRPFRCSRPSTCFGFASLCPSLGPYLRHLPYSSPLVLFCSPFAPCCFCFFRVSLRFLSPRPLAACSQKKRGS